MSEHYELRADLTIVYNGRVLYRIEATKDLPDHDVRRGDLGGYVQNKSNLSGEAWIYDEAKVYNKARVYDKAKIKNRAVVSDSARIYGEAQVCADSQVYGHTKIYEKAIVAGTASICDYTRLCGSSIVGGSSQISGKAFVSGTAQILGLSRVSGKAVICGNAKVRDSSFVSKGKVSSERGICNIPCLDGANITVTEEFIGVGGGVYSRDEWFKFTDGEILKLYGKSGIQFWRKWKPVIELICERVKN